MSYGDVLDRFGSIVEDDIKNRFGRLKMDGGKYHPFMGQVYEALEEFVLRGGRRLAACSTLMIYKGYRGQIDDKIVKVSSGIELYRHSILAHDDIVDKELLRRGGETLHRTLGKRIESLGFGSTIFAGNILYALALEAVLKSGFSPKETSEVAGLLAVEFRAVNESQILDLLFEYTEPEFAEWEVMAGKRAASLFKASMLTGAVLAYAPPGEIKLLEDAAKHIGYAFDIQDDIIDTFATREQYGRDPCGDISKGKKPLHIAIALHRDRRLATIMQMKRVPSLEEIGEIQSLIRDCGALDEAKAISKDHAREAQRLISATQMNEEEKTFFISFIKYVDESLDWYK